MNVSCELAFGPITTIYMESKLLYSEINENKSITKTQASTGPRCIYMRLKAFSRHTAHCDDLHIKEVFSAKKKPHTYTSARGRGRACVRVLLQYKPFNA